MTITSEYPDWEPRPEEIAAEFRALVRNLSDDPGVSEVTLLLPSSLLCHLGAEQVPSQSQLRGDSQC